MLHTAKFLKFWRVKSDAILVKPLSTAVTSHPVDGVSSVVWYVTCLLWALIHLLIHHLSSPWSAVFHWLYQCTGILVHWNQSEAPLCFNCGICMNKGNILCWIILSHTWPSFQLTCWSWWRLVLSLLERDVWLVLSLLECDVCECEWNIMQWAWLQACYTQCLLE